MARIYACISDEPDCLQHLNFATSRNFLLKVEQELTHFVLLYADNYRKPSHSAVLPWRISNRPKTASTTLLPPRDWSLAGSYFAPAKVVNEGECGSEQALPCCLCFPPLPARLRYLLHSTAERFRLHSESHGCGVRRTVVRLTPHCCIPVLKWEDFLPDISTDDGKQEGMDDGGGGNGPPASEGSRPSDVLAEVDGSLRQLVLGPRPQDATAVDANIQVVDDGSNLAMLPPFLNSFAEYAVDEANAGTDVEPVFQRGSRSERLKQVTLYGTASSEPSEKGGSRRDPLFRTDLLQLRSEWRLPSADSFLLKFRVSYDFHGSGSTGELGLGGFRVYLYADKQDLLHFLPRRSCSLGRAAATARRRVVDVSADNHSGCCRNVVALEFRPSMGPASHKTNSASGSKAPLCWWDVAAYGCALMGPEEGRPCAAAGEELMEDQPAGRVRRGRGTFRAGTDLFSPQTEGVVASDVCSGAAAPAAYSCRVADPFEFRTSFWIACYRGQGVAGGVEGVGGVTGMTSGQEKHIVVGMGQFPQWVIMHLRIPDEGSWHVPADEQTREGLLKGIGYCGSAAQSRMSCAEEGLEPDAQTPLGDVSVVQSAKLEELSNQVFRIINITRPHAFRFFGFGLSAGAEESVESVSLCLRDISAGSDELVGRSPFAEREHIIEVRRSPDGEPKNAVGCSWRYHDAFDWMKMRMRTSDDIRAICGRSRGLSTLPGASAVATETPSLSSISSTPACGDLIESGNDTESQPQPVEGRSDFDTSEGDLVLVVCSSSDSARSIMTDITSHMQSMVCGPSLETPSLLSHSIASLPSKQRKSAGRRRPPVGSCDNGYVRVSSLAPCKGCSSYYRGDAHHSTVNAAAASSQRISNGKVGNGVWAHPAAGTPTSVHVPPDSWLVCLSEVLNAFDQSTQLEVGVLDLWRTLRKRFSIAVSPPCAPVPASRLDTRRVSTDGDGPKPEKEVSTMSSSGSSRPGSLYCITATRGLCLSSGAQRMLRANLPSHDKKMLLRRDPSLESSAATS
eukprot:GHVS01068523.1.p1 GENE.GHVS01068523.1~~GHVS01068523.1.p1  ORF type:complete len:1069 (+),score=158.37 GHVS01068523.1:153-3209(+)